jgi:hypothetical protein
VALFARQFFEYRVRYESQSLFIAPVFFLSCGRAM